MSPVGVIAGVAYYDRHDVQTFAAVITAVQAMNGPSVLVIDGADRAINGAESATDRARLAELAQAIEDHGVIHVFVITSTTGASPLETALAGVGFTHVTRRPDDFDQIVRDCYAITEPGDAVVYLSVGTALSGEDASRGHSTGYREAVMRLAQLTHSL